MYSLQQPISRPHLFEYIRDLVAHQQAAQAALVWRQAASMAGLSAYQPSPENLLVNGDFSLEILDGGFDWMHQKTRGVNLALDPNETHSSARSLRIIFDGPGIEDAGIRQLVPVSTMPDRQSVRNDNDTAARECNEAARWEIGSPSQNHDCNEN